MKIFSKRNIIIVIILLIIASVVFIFFIPSETVYTEQAKIIKTEHQDFIIATGSIGARDDIDLSFRQTGPVSKIYFEAGDAVQKGSLIAQVNINSLQTQLESQRLALQQEIIKLDSYISGPETLARDRINAESLVARQSLENASQRALSNAQEVAVSIENTVRSDFDVFFDGTIENLRLILDVNLPNKSQIVNSRKELDVIFNQWRKWIVSEDLTNQQVSTIISQLIGNLYSIQEVITMLYDQTRTRRFISDENETLFLKILEMRELVQKSITQIIGNRNTILSTLANSKLKQTALAEDLSGSTSANRKAQATQVEVEQEKIRLLELQIAEAKIIAPFAGIVGQVLIEEGEYATIGELAIRFISESGFEVLADVTEAEIQEIVVGEEISANVDAIDEDITVRVRTVNTTEKKVSDVPVYSIVFDVVDEDVLLRPGMTVDVFVPFGEKREVLAVPQEAVLRFGKKNSVILLKGEEKIEVPIDIDSITREGLIGIRGDIKEGDVVVFNKKNNEL